MRIVWRAAVFAWAAIPAALFVACSSSSGSSSSGGAADGGGSETSTDAGLGSETPVDAPTGSGSGTVTGSVAGAPFGTVATALWAGAADDPATTVVYLFSASVTCSELAVPGWDKQIADATKVIEMKAIGTTPGPYKVVTTVTPAPGEASVNFTLSSRTATPKEEGSTAGSVTLEKLIANTSAKGSFSLTFGASTLTGSFDAVFCPGGHEP